MASRTTDTPNSTLRHSATASRPCHGVAHCEMTAAPPWLARLRRSIVNSAPVKKVPTAVPISSGPRMPLINRKALKVRSPKTLAGLRRYS